MARKLLSPEYALLGLLDLQPMHGYELHQRLTKELGQIWHVSLSQAYNILKRLEHKNLIYGDLALNHPFFRSTLFHASSASSSTTHPSFLLVKENGFIGKNFACASSVSSLPPYSLSNESFGPEAKSRCCCCCCISAMS